jgi:hypothetical protein
MPLQATSGAASYDAFGGGVPVVPNYIEEVFSTWLYTGNSSTQTITNGIDLAGKGGLVWTKNRTAPNPFQNHNLVDSARGLSAGVIRTNLTNAQTGTLDDITSFNANGYSLGYVTGSLNDSPSPYVSWTFRKQPKFFDVVTFTKSSSPQTISHNLGSTPACIFIKRTDSTGGWLVAHRGYTGGITAGYTLLNTTDAFTSNANAVTAVDSTTFTLGSAVVSGDFVAYLFAHDAGGFGLTGTDNVISCGSFTTDGSGNATVNLGYEPQWLLLKRTDAANNWFVYDNMRGMSVGANDPYLIPNSANEENGSTNLISLSSTGFIATGLNGGAASASEIYIAIRRGPMKVPTVGTSVFSPQSTTISTASNTIVSSGTAGPIDLVINQQTSASGGGGITQSRLTGGNYLITSSTGAESSGSYTNWDRMTGTKPTPWTDGQPVAVFAFKRAPSFFDVVCYTGTGATLNVTHNLGVVPEMMIVKGRNSGFARSWAVYHSALGNTKYFYLNNTSAPVVSSTAWNNTTPTSTVFTVDILAAVNYDATETYVAYLFATCAGVSKVGSYTGNGSTQTINCGFGAGGARFVLIRRTDTTGDWYVYDTARGMTVLTDPYLLLNSTAAEVATLGSVTTVSTGFALDSTILAAINVNAGTYIFLAIA